MSAREELAGIVGSSIITRSSPKQTADAILAAGYSKPRTITTREEVEALPDGSVLLDSSGDVANLRDGFWFSYETAPMTHHRMAKYTPATVLFTPKES